MEASLFHAFFPQTAQWQPEAVQAFASMTGDKPMVLSVSIRLGLSTKNCPTIWIQMCLNLD